MNLELSSIGNVLELINPRLGDRRIRAMPVLECECGMVMSVSAAMPRNICLRCRSESLQPMAMPALASPVRERMQQQRPPTATMLAFTPRIAWGNVALASVASQ